MFALKLILATVFVVASARHVPWEEITDEGYLLLDEEERPVLLVHQSEPEESYHPGNAARTRRASGSVTLNSDGGLDLGAKVPLGGNDKNRISALGTFGLNDNLNPASKGLGLQLDNVNGHSLTVMKQNVPGREDSWTGAGKMNVFHNDNHNVDVRGSITRHMPVVPNVPNFNTVGGGVDYMFKDKIGGSLGMSSTPFFDRKDYSAMGNLNVFRNPTTSVDFNGGFSKIDTPHFSTGWQPSYGLTFSKYF